MKVLITRPEPGASATAAMLRQRGLEPVLAPCLTIRKLPAHLPERPAAIVLTSGQAVSALPPHYRDTPCFCVGDATAARLGQAGFTAVRSAGGNSEDLLRLVVAYRIAGLHLLAVGRGNGLTFAAALRACGILVLRRTVYAARPVARLPKAVRAALAAGEITQALFYSAETARAFSRLRPETGQAEALAISPAAAEAVQGLPWRAIRVAVAPNESALLALLNESGLNESGDR